MPIGKVSNAKLYKDLEDAHAALADFRNKHRAVFSHAAELTEEIEILDAKVKTVLRALYADKPGGEYEAYKGSSLQLVVTTKFSRSVEDIPAFMDALGEQADSVVKQVIDLKELDRLVEAGEVAPTLVAKYITRTPMTPAVSLRPVTTEE